MKLWKSEEERDQFMERYPYSYSVHYRDTDVEIFSNKEIDWEEALTYSDRAYSEKYHKYLKQIALHIDGDYVDISYGLSGPMPKFERTRRITGYLVGTLDRFNDAKRAEESERVKHSVVKNRV